MHDLRSINSDQRARAKHYQESAAYISAVARAAFNAGDYATAKWYQQESAFEYRAARELVDAVLGRGIIE